MIPVRSPRRGLILGLAIALGSASGLGLLVGYFYLLAYGSEGACEETGAQERTAQVSAATPAAAAGTTPVADRTMTECMDDSGDPWITANSLYTHGGDVRPLFTHYWDTAAADGWKAVGTRAGAADRFRSGSGMCFRKDVAGEPALLRVSSTKREELFVSVEAALDGSAMPC
ncbi:hypothetical protein PV721_09160 [Streptomyces sp. MB09-01]|uniref:hypothetical protein n=1 Tax=Streptomyces sp. MB09-01 TaxID=3028666 RepID=UPI0029B1B0B1|nr:hypothetical protein [Streptomyces sp. MB09-01]MDX3534536.1 hypothetical protein [Streptomyces sp. MB09-01]